MAQTLVQIRFQNELVDLIFDRYPDDAIIYPGHGDDTTSAPSVRTWPSGAKKVGAALSTRAAYLQAMRAACLPAAG